MRCLAQQCFVSINVPTASTILGLTINEISDKKLPFLCSSFHLQSTLDFSKYFLVQHVGSRNVVSTFTRAAQCTTKWRSTSLQGTRRSMYSSNFHQTESDNCLRESKQTSNSAPVSSLVLASKFFWSSFSRRSMRWHPQSSSSPST